MLNLVSIYTTAELCDKLELPAIQASGTKSKRTSRISVPDNAANDTIFEGARNTSLMSLAGSLRARGMSRDGILAALQIANQEQVQPPLPDSEVACIAESVMRYPSAAHEMELRRSLNDIGNANRLVAMFGVELRYVPERGAWLWWNPSNLSGWYRLASAL